MAIMAQKTVPWSIEEVNMFLSLLADERIQQKLDGAMQNKKSLVRWSRTIDIYRCIATYSHQRPFEQCREKLKKVTVVVSVCPPLMTPW